MAPHIQIGDDRTRMILMQGTAPGTPLGETVRFIMQFKSFPIAFGQKVLGRAIKGGVGGKADAAGLANIIAGSWVMGYMAMTLKDIAAGRSPRDPTRPETPIKAFLQGGGAGIYGDFLLAKATRFDNTPLETAAGPTLGSAAEILGLISSAARGNAGATDVVLHNTPYGNIWWGRAALAYLILYRLQESLNPGFLRRMERRLKDDYGQSFIVPPTAAVR